MVETYRCFCTSMRQSHKNYPKSRSHRRLSEEVHLKQNSCPCGFETKTHIIINDCHRFTYKHEDRMISKYYLFLFSFFSFSISSPSVQLRVTRLFTCMFSNNHRRVPMYFIADCDRGPHSKCQKKTKAHVRA